MPELRQSIQFIDTLRLAKEGLQMSIFLMFGKYSSEAMKDISPDRTQKARETIIKKGGNIISMYAVMGEHDLVFTIDFPDAMDHFREIRSHTFVIVPT